MPDQPHVALITREYPPHVYGGAGVHVEYLARELAKKIQIDVHCWSDPLADGALQSNPRIIRQNPPADISAAPQIQQAKFKTALEALALNLTEVASLSGANIIHTHTWYAAMAGFLCQRLYNIPFVLTTHSLEPLRAWKAEQLGSGYALSSWMEKTAIESADAIIAVSQGTRADILRAYPAISPDRIHVIYNGIDLDQYRRTDDTSALRTYGIDLTRPYILFLGRITRQKGVTHLVDAMPQLPPDTQVVLCAGAPDTEDIAKEMREKITEAKKKNPHIVWIEKMVSKPGAIQLYSHCRAFCCPSVYEPFGIINLEAMACGAPVVASATGGILEVVVDPAINKDQAAGAEQTGFLVPFTPTGPENLPQNPTQFAKDLAAKLTILLNDEALAKKLGQNGRFRTEQHFSWSTIADQTIALYRSLL